MNESVQNHSFAGSLRTKNSEVFVQFIIEFQVKCQLLHDEVAQSYIWSWNKQSAHFGI